MCCASGYYLSTFPFKMIYLCRAQLLSGHHAHHQIYSQSMFQLDKLESVVLKDLMTYYYTLTSSSTCSSHNST